MECKKCNSIGSIVLRGKDVYCESCFVTNTNHKFRACIGKNKILSKNEKVLVCSSGGAGSTVLQDLIYNGLAMESHKMLRISPFFLHVMGLQTNQENVGNIIEQCKKYQFQIYIMHISEYMTPDCELPTISTIPTVDESKVHQLHAFLNSMPATVHNDILLKIKRSLFLRTAKLLNCQFIFTAETTTTLAMHLLSNLTLGRGSQVENDVGFADTRNDDIKLLRPMKDISVEEINHYLHLKKLTPIQLNDMKDNSLQSVIKAFVSDLQIGFPATISTVCKTADKLGVQESCERRDKCVICESELGTRSNKLTAMEATNFSRMVSDKFHTPDENPSQYNEVPDVSNSLFPYFQKKVCYGCSRNLSELDETLLPVHIMSKVLAED